MISIDALAEGYYSSSDPQFIDWDKVEEEALIEDLQRSIDTFEADPADIAETILSAHRIYKDAREHVDELDWTPMEKQFESVGLKIWFM